MTNNDNLLINPKKETKRIINFLQQTFTDQGIINAVIGLSGGIDSTLSFYLLKEVLNPKNIFPVHMYYFEPAFTQINQILKKAKIPQENINIISIKEQVDSVIKLNSIDKYDKVRIGNISARMRMIVLFDLAKKTGALVCGTENKSENLLGYFTRFGDQASDIEPISHLFKTQVLQLAKYLNIPKEIIKQQPTAGLWNGQTDEGEFGFTYEEADQVLYLFYDQHLSIGAIQKKGLPNAQKIITRCQKNEFKHSVPYHL